MPGHIRKNWRLVGHERGLELLERHTPLAVSVAGRTVAAEAGECIVGLTEAVAVALGHIVVERQHHRVFVRIAGLAVMERIRTAGHKVSVAVVVLVVAKPASTAAVLVVCCSSLVVVPVLLLLHYCGSSLWLYEHWQACCTGYNSSVHSSVSLALSPHAYARL